MTNRITAFAVLLFFSLIACEKKKSSENNLKEIPHQHFDWDRFDYPNENNIQHYSQLIQDVKSTTYSRTPNPLLNREWVTQGPNNIGGRISAVAVHPKDINTIYIGLSNGGLFKTIDGGSHWTPVFENEITLSIGAISIDPTNPEIVYAGTGDPNINGNSFIGFGLFKSINGGKTWNNIALQNVRVINEILIDPLDSKIIYVAAMGNPFEISSDRGVYKSLNGGLTFTKVLFVSDSAGISDIAIHPTNNKILFVASHHRVRTTTQSITEGSDSKIFKSIDQGVSWKPIMAGINEKVLGRIAIEISASTPHTLYARTIKFINSCNGSQGHHLEGLYTSHDVGETWSKVNIDYNTLDCELMGGFGWYFGRMAINPLNHKNIFLLGVALWESQDGGIHWSNVDFSSNENLHADKHLLIFDKDFNRYLATDGGLYKYTVARSEWKNIDHLPSTQFYRVTLNPNEPQLYYGGAQDNGTSGGNINNIDNWDHLFGGDGFSSVFHKAYPNTHWYETQNGGLWIFDLLTSNYDRFTKGISGTLNWDTPFFSSNFNNDSMYCGSNRVFVNAEPLIADWKAVSPELTITGPWPNINTPTISCIAESPLQQHQLIAGTTNGNIWIGNSLTQSWNRITNNLPPGYVTNVEFSPTDSKTLFVSFSKYRSNDMNSYLFKSIDNGNSWSSITSTALNQIPVFDFVIIPKTNDKIIAAATLLGVYATLDGGLSWYRVGTNMPIIPIYSIIYNSVKNEIVAGSFARSILTYKISEITNLLTPTSKLNPIILTPNPCYEFITIHLDDQYLNNPMHFSFIDLNGNIILESDVIYNGTNNIDISQIPANTYLVKIRCNSSNWVKKIIKIDRSN